MTATDTSNFLASPQLKPRAGDLFNIDAALTEEERAVRDSVRAFVDEKVLPIIGQCYVEGRFPKELIREMGANGYFGANLPEGSYRVTVWLAPEDRVIEIEAGEIDLRRTS